MEAPTPTDLSPDASDLGSTAEMPRGLGPFTDLSPHACGGLGEVFRATDPELHRTVAIKRLQKQHAGNPESGRRFLLEAEVTARLEHPGVVPVYRLIRDAGEQPAYAMRFVEGQTLAAAIAAYHAGPPDPIGFRRLLQAFLQVCQTVAYAHSRGVIHRDLKPQNVMLGKFGETQVLDWGLAKVVGRPDHVREAGAGEALDPASGDSGPVETAMGSAIGTPAYMSPEQAAGRWDVVAQASDVYGLGATLYTILTGRPPLERGNWPEMQQKIQRGDFPRPRQVKPDVPRPLEAVCLKAMALDPPGRYPSAGELAGEVEHWLADEPVAAYREPLPGRLARWGRRHRTLVAASALSLVTAVALLVALVVAVRREQDRTDTARRMAEANYRDARGAVDDYLTSVSEEALLDEPGMQPLRQRLLQLALAYHTRFIERRANDPDAIVDLARSQAALAMVTKEIHSSALALPGFREAIRVYRELEIRRPGDPEIRNVLAECYERTADVQNALNQRREALENCDRAIGLFEELVADRAADVRSRHNLALAVFTKARIKHADERTKEATALYERAASLQEEVVAQSGGADGERAALALYIYRMSNCLANTGRAAKAKESCHKAIGLYEELMRDHPRAYKYRHGHAMALLALATLDRRSGLWAEVARCEEQARSELAELVRDNPDVIGLREALALADHELARCYLFKLGQRDRGAAALRNAIQGFQSLWRGDDTDLICVTNYAGCLQGLATIQAQDGQYLEAHANLRRACELQEQAVRKSPDNPVIRGELAGSYGDLADASERLGRIDEAAGLYHKAIAMMRSIFDGGIGHAGRDIASWTCGLSRKLRAEGRLEEAADMLDRLRGELVGEPDALYQIACSLSLCAADAGALADRPVSEREASRRRYGGHGIAALRAATRAGFRGLERLRDEPALNALRPLREFQLIRMDLAFPADVFVRDQ